MSKIVQLVGHVAHLANQYIGAIRELTVDVSNWDLRLHDGTTPGGRIIQSRDNADQRYQARSTELDGLNEFEPQERGFFVRLGPGAYTLRHLTVNDDNLTVTSPDGYDANPYLSLAPVIESEHTWVGQQLATAVWQFQAGINADVSGNLTGNVEGDVVGNVTGNLTGNATGNHTGSFEGDVDVRGYTLQVDAGSISTDAIQGLEEFVKLHSLPIGVIMIWSGSAASIPALKEPSRQTDSNQRVESLRYH